ncbi:expressed protein [Echinococcus multilocularis]|uniref:Expressed protein n=1 Tax=Echinococcus multilocularis TaxID=6211 RepID=A0A068YA20_ECHMU|nr:expressed protein [Echinococcus multilocularis]
MEKYEKEKTTQDVLKKQKVRINKLLLTLNDMSDEVERLTARLDVLDKCATNLRANRDFPSEKKIENMQRSIRGLQR